MFLAAPLLFRRLLVALLLIAGTTWASVSPAAAHTGFESSSPSDGASTDEPVSVISLTFSGPAAPAGDGFVVLDPAGTVRVPDDVSTTDDLTFTLEFDEPLTGGVVGVRWSVAAPDAHPIDGSFSFTAPTAAPTTEPPTEQAQTTEVPAAEVPAAEDPATEAPPVTSELDETDGLLLDAETSAAAPVDLDDFLDTSASKAQGASLIGSLSRIVGLLGAIGVIGGAIFAAVVLRGHRTDIRAVLFIVRRAAVLVALSAIAEAVVQLATVAGRWSGVWSPSNISQVLGSSFGLAIALRVAGGSLAAAQTRLHTHSAAGVTDPVLAVKQLTSVTAGRVNPPADPPTTTPGTDPFINEGDEAWHLSNNLAAFAGVALITLSFLFDGHTVSEGPRWLHALANLIHVTTAATWAGGVIMLAVVIARRHRRGVDTQALQLGVRFSVVAVIALVVAALAGTVLAIVILDSVSEIWSTTWGRFLVLKVLLVAIAAAGGGYNHRVVVPALEKAPNDPEIAHQFRTVVTIEAIALVAVTVVTALLIASSAV